MEFDNTQILIWNTLVMLRNSQSTLASSKQQNIFFVWFWEAYLNKTARVFINTAKAVCALLSNSKTS